MCTEGKVSTRNPKTLTCSVAHLRIDKEGDPADNDKEAGWEIVGDNVE